MLAPSKYQRKLSGEWNAFWNGVSVAAMAVVGMWVVFWFFGWDVPFDWSGWILGPLFLLVSACVNRYIRSKEVVMTQSGLMIGHRRLFWVEWTTVPYDEIESVTPSGIFGGVININLVRETEFGKRITFLPGWKSQWPHTNLLDEINDILLWHERDRSNRIEREAERKTLNLS